MLCACASFAQPYKFGCHLFRQPSTHIHSPQANSDRDIQDVIARSDTFDILNYDIAIDVTDYTNRVLRAVTTITYTPLITQLSIGFDLMDTLTVDSVTANGSPLPFSHSSDVLRIQLPEASVGSTYALTAYYHGHGTRDPDWGGFYFESGYIYNLGIGLSTIPPNFGKVWYPCFDSFVERATYAYHVKSSGTFRAHCQGTFLGEQQLAGDTVIRSYSFDQPIPTHIAAIAVADYQDSSFVHTGAYGDVPITLTAKPAVLNAMVSKFTSIGDAIDAYEFWYGPYPYQRVGYVLTTDGALEIATNIAYPDFMPSQSLFENRHLFGHELGHHWWGDLVTPHTHNDMWLKEGPAEYSAHLLEEWIGGEQAFIDVVKDNQVYVLEQAHLQDGGFQALSPMPDPIIYGLHTYYKGAAVMHNLRGYLGDTLFRQAMHNVLIDHANSTLSATGFQDALQQATGVDMAPFFNDQVFTPGFSVFTVRSMNAQNNGGLWSVDLQLQQRLRAAPAFHEQVPLDLTLIGANWQRQEFHIVAGGEFSNVNVQADFEPVMAVLNGHNRLNQARMDLEFTIHPGVSFPSLVKRTDFRLFQNTIVDSTLMRVEHIWAGPDQDNMDWGIYQISSTHYWNVDGIWPEGTLLNARIYYHGADSTGLDQDLFSTSEDNAILVYRAAPTDPWQLYPDYTLSAGNLNDGSGYIKIDVLRKGQYAFAKGNVLASINSLNQSNEDALQVLPNPANNALTARGHAHGSEILAFDVFAANGELVQRSSAPVMDRFEKRLDVADLSIGEYFLRVLDAKGGTFGEARFTVAR